MTDVFDNDNALGPFDSSNAGLDPDNDGLTNLEEFNITQDPYHQS